MCLLSDELTATAAIYPWRHTAPRLMGGGLLGASTRETLPRHPRLSQLVPRTRPARKIQANQSMGTIWPCCFAVAVPGQNGAGAAAGTLFGRSQCYCLLHGVPKGADDRGREGLYRAVGRSMLWACPGLRIRVETLEERRRGKGRGWRVWWQNLSQLLLTARAAHPFVLVTPTSITPPRVDAAFNFFLIQHRPFSSPLSMSSAAALPNFTCPFRREILCLWQHPFPQALLQLQLHSHSHGHGGGHLVGHEPSKWRDELPDLCPRAVAWRLTLLLPRDQSLPGGVRMRMKGDILVLGCHEPQAQLISAPPCEGEQISGGLASESGAQVWRKGNLELTEQNWCCSDPSRRPHHLWHSHSKLGWQSCMSYHSCSLHNYLIEKNPIVFLWKNLFD